MRIIGKERKGEREEEEINLPVMFCFHTPQKAMPLFLNHTPKEKKSLFRQLINKLV